MRVKRPNVIRVSGNVSISRIGLRNVLNMEKTRETKNAAINEDTCTPGSKYAAIMTAIVFTKRLISIFIRISIAQEN